jgi:hypothetical protein
VRLAARKYLWASDFPDNEIKPFFKPRHRLLRIFFDIDAGFKFAALTAFSKNQRRIFSSTSVAANSY